jgi:hypothetical protein
MRKFFTGALLLILACNMQGQDKIRLSKVELPKYDFIDYQYNKIQIPGKDSSSIKSFYQKVDKLMKKGEGRINILHIGGSHVQADMFSHQVRRDFDGINKHHQTPRGFIFPYTVAKTNNPLNYKVTYTGEWSAARNVQVNREMSLGMGGIAVYTSDPQASIQVNLNPNGTPKRWNFNRLRLLGHTEDENGRVTPVLHYKGEIVKPSFDLPTQTYLFELPELEDSFHVGFIQEDAVPHTFVVTGFIPEKEEPGIVYHSIGVNGASVPSYLGCEFFENELPLIAPDLVIFGIGINDAAKKDFTEDSFIQNYNSLIQSIKKVNPDCAFIFITNNDSFRKITKRKYSVNINGLIAKDAFYKIAQENQGGIWDLFSLMGGLRSMQTWQMNELAAKDKVHFSRAGYELLGNMLYNALIDFYLNNNIESGL